LQFLSPSFYLHLQVRFWQRCIVVIHVTVHIPVTGVRIIPDIIQEAEAVHTKAGIIKTRPHMIITGKESNYMYCHVHIIYNIENLS